MMRTRPRVVIFDVVETLMSIEPLAQRFREIGLPVEMVPRWYDRLLRDGMALTLAGDYEPFPRVASAALRTLARGTITGAAVRHVLSGFAELPAYPDAEPAMRLLAEQRVRIACLTNGAAQTTLDFLDRTGLARYVEHTISVAAVGHWKPPPAVYRYGLDQVASSAGETAMVAVHAWDCHGAGRAGLTTGWAARLEGHYSEVFARPDVIGVDLVEVARGLLALPPGPR